MTECGYFPRAELGWKLSCWAIRGCKERAFENTFPVFKGKWYTNLSEIDIWFLFLFVQKMQCFMSLEKKVCKIIRSEGCSLSLSLIWRCGFVSVMCVCFAFDQHWESYYTNVCSENPIVQMCVVRNVCSVWWTFLWTIYGKILSTLTHTHTQENWICPARLDNEPNLTDSRSRKFFLHIDRRVKIFYIEKLKSFHVESVVFVLAATSSQTEKKI